MALSPDVPFPGHGVLPGCVIRTKSTPLRGSISPEAAPDANRQAPTTTAAIVGWPMAGGRTWRVSGVGTVAIPSGPALSGHGQRTTGFHLVKCDCPNWSDVDGRRHHLKRWFCPAGAQWRPCSTGRSVRDVSFHRATGGWHKQQSASGTSDQTVLTGSLALAKPGPTGDYAACRAPSAAHLSRAMSMRSSRTPSSGGPYRFTADDPFGNVCFSSTGATTSHSWSASFPYT